MHTLDMFAIRHAIKNHGDAKSEAKRGNVGLTNEDFESIPKIIANAQTVVYGMRNARMQDIVAYISKDASGNVLYLEEVRVGRKTLAAESIRKYPATTHATSILKSLRHIRPDRLRGGGLIVVDRVL